MRIGVIVGATGGIGAACARALASAADRVILTGRKPDALADLTEELAPASSLTVDLTAELDRSALRKQIEALDGELQWVVVASGMPLQRELEKASPAEIAEIFAVNLVGPALLIKQLLDLRWTPEASIIVIGSISAVRALPNRSAYAASKAGLEHLARSLAAELAPLGIRVNIVSPGVIDTPFLGQASQARGRWIDQRVPMARAGEPREVAELVRYLAVEAPGYVTGARVVVDGGAETWL